MIMITNTARAHFFHRAFQWGIRCRNGRCATPATRSLHVDGSMIEIAENVLQAIKNNEPVVALESTIITHGMPYPANLETALKVENTVRSQVKNSMNS